MHKPDDAQAEELVQLLDQLMAGGTQHINLSAGDGLHVQTVNSTDCGKLGACAVPTLGEEPDDESTAGNARKEGE
ncbi:MAG: hypothetical protein IK130_05845 [Oscillospiraceae bacterium]|nr:hypothetical protein [Oscillospiraceae bacterium]